MYGYWRNYTVAIVEMVTVCNGARTTTCGNPQKNDAMAYARESPDKEKCATKDIEAS